MLHGGLTSHCHTKVRSWVSLIADFDATYGAGVWQAEMQLVWGD